MPILIIEDDRQIHDLIVPVLEAHSFRAWSAYNGVEGLHMFRQTNPDLLLLSVRLPDMGGWEVCQQIRAVANTPIIMLFAVAAGDADLNRALDMGANDYLIKPLRPDICLARITAMLPPHARSASPPAHPMYADTHLTIDLNRKQVRVKGNPVALSILEQRLLELLVRRMDQIVPTTEIIEDLWPEDGTETTLREHSTYVRIYISRLRQVLEPNPRTPIYITTDRGFGYRFNSRPPSP